MVSRPFFYGSLFLCISAAVSCAVFERQPEWHPADGPLMTRWAQDVTPNAVLPGYPRPQMVREAWQNLNGLWDYAVREKNQTHVKTYDGKILVPFPVESALSGVLSGLTFFFSDSKLLNWNKAISTCNR